jgi:Endonuclease NucS
MQTNKQNMHLLIPYIQLSHHEDPLFTEFTYGDVGQRARQLKELKPGTFVFFHTSKQSKKVITAFYVVDRVIDTAIAAHDRLIKEKYKNPHILEFLSGQRKHDEDAVLFGDPITSRILEKPLLFNRELANKLSLKIKFPADKSDTQIIGSATRAWRKLTEEDKNILLDEIKVCESQESHFSFRSSDEVAETLEKDIERYIIKNPHLIGKGFKFLRSQKRTDNGRLDILLEDQAGNLVVVEVKLGRIGREARDQTKNYVRYLREKENKKVRGVIVCAGVMPAYEEDLRKQKDVQIFIHGWNLGIQAW